MPAIGFVRTARTELERTPVQAGANRGEEGVLEIAGEYVEGLAGLAAFDYAWLLSWLDRPDRPTTSLTQVPYLLRREQRRMGIFAMRGPRRVNPIGLSLVRILGVEGREVRFAGVDLLDGTPVLDLKPYVTASTARRASRAAAGSTTSPSPRAPRRRTSRPGADGEVLAALRDRVTDHRWSRSRREPSVVRGPETRRRQGEPEWTPAPPP
ncbi:tRNA (N6-threonylcarbamoyladenosine(37)-N6)-methyltransferase TrmO [Amycolatopsis sp. NPDC051903]|uniref:tRNA (N6-threonylcarbamoyladenosine(37)-N6)-methyltransferase TrmO n=1 Tax=Amycolatopsis sp. NPDC051903 TaxID=3363936 RepID=UPI0037B6B1FF